MFLDERIAGLYRDETHQRDLFTAFAAFAIAIGCLGLVGLSAYTVERRTKEMGIRKALGASAFDVARLLIVTICQASASCERVGMAGGVVAHAALAGDIRISH